eukprot:1982906-Pyramimonas_sp.AAC.1
MQVIEELLPPPSSTDASYIPPKNCKVPDVPGEAAAPRFESLWPGRVVDLSEPLWKFELCQLLVQQSLGQRLGADLHQVRSARSLQDPDRPLTPVAAEDYLATVPVAVESLHLGVRVAEVLGLPVLSEQPRRVGDSPRELDLVGLLVHLVPQLV